MKVLFGAIITDGAGKIGGHQLRRNGSTRVLQNKTYPKKSKNLLKNSKLPLLGLVFAKWSQITEGDRILWNAAALLYLFPDKFGNLKNLTGRQFFTKLNVQTQLYFGTWSDILTLSNVLLGFTLEGFVINQAQSIITIDASVGSNDINLIFGAISLRNEANNPPPESIVIAYQTTFEDWNDADAFAYLENSIGTIRGDNWMLTALWEVNEWGFISARQSLKVFAIG